MNLKLAKKALSAPGAVGIIPTDTVYGLVARATDRASVKRIYDLKNGRTKPGTIIAGSIDQLVDLGLKRRYLLAVNDYWPAPLSVIIPCGNELKYLHLGKSGLAVRIPRVKALLNLTKDIGPLLTTSANMPGKKPASNLKEAKAYFSDRIDFYIEGGDLSDHQPSTIIRVVDDTIELIREGAYEFKDI